jgi:hypothetical protein
LEVSFPVLNLQSIVIGKNYEIYYAIQCTAKAVFLCQDSPHYFTGSVSVPLLDPDPDTVK